MSVLWPRNPQRKRQLNTFWLFWLLGTKLDKLLISAVPVKKPPAPQAGDPLWEDDTFQLSKGNQNVFLWWAFCPDLIIQRCSSAKSAGVKATALNSCRRNPSLSLFLGWASSAKPCSWKVWKRGQKGGKMFPGFTATTGYITVSISFSSCLEKQQKCYSDFPFPFWGRNQVFCSLSTDTVRDRRPRRPNPFLCEQSSPGTEPWVMRNWILTSNLGRRETEKLQ